MRKSIQLLALLALLAWLPATAQTEGESFDREGYELAISTILCDCGCHPQSVKACACGRAAEMRKEMAQLISSGGPNGSPMTGEQVVGLYVQRHGEDIRIAPTATGFNLVAWLGPLVGLLVAMALMTLLVQRLAARRGQTIQGVPATTAPMDDVYQERLKRALEEMD